jgi:predicted DNA-binding protein (UPF0251 family)
MPRPLKCRRVAFMPGVTFFKPAGVPLRELEQVRLSVEEAEAIRLKEMEGLEQEAGAEKMNVSRPTFQRILASARQKMADALLNGKAIRIEGGNFKIASRRFRCANRHEWEALGEPVSPATPQICPVCNSPDIESITPSVSVRRAGRRGLRGTKHIV